MNLNKPKLLVYIVAFNHEKFILNVLKRIPLNLSKKYEVEILINDDSSEDKTFDLSNQYAQNAPTNFKFKILYNPENQGYGGNQKIGYHYAIKNNFDFVALLHGDGQYAPEYLEKLVEPLNRDDIDAVFGSRMIIKGGALKGKMPLYKFIANKVITFFQNFLLKTHFSEFHSGYRVYNVSSLKRIPFHLNSNSYPFDTEIIVQFINSKFKIIEIAIPTFYGSEISYVNGTKYAFQICFTTIKAKLQKLGIFYDRKFDCEPEGASAYLPKENFASTHSEIINLVKNNSRILDLGCNDGGVGFLLKEKKNCSVVGVDNKKNSNSFKLDNFILRDLNLGPPNLDYNNFDYIIMLDVIEHLIDPEMFVDRLKGCLIRNEKVKIIVSTPNISFIIMRIMLLFGTFNYGKRGILDRTHTRLFTFSTLSYLFEQCQYSVELKKGIPAPFPLAISNKLISGFLIKLNILLIKIYKSLFSYQIIFKVKPKISLELLLEKATVESKKKN